MDFESAATVCEVCQVKEWGLGFAGIGSRGGELGLEEVCEGEGEGCLVVDVVVVVVVVGRVGGC